jgi:hypothetical protein
VCLPRRRCEVDDFRRTPAQPLSSSPPLPPSPFPCAQDNWQPYLDAAKALYRDLVSVTRTGGSDGPISVASYVYAVEGLDGPGSRPVPLHPGGKGDGSAAHSVCWVCVDPMRRTANVLHHTWVPFW